MSSNRALKFIFSLWLLLSVSSTWAQELVILGLFKNKVVMTENGQRYVLNVGDKTSQGTELVSANSQEAVLIVGGEKQNFSLGTHIQSNYSTAPAKQVKIPRDSRGMYRTEGTVNGTSIHFLIDSGAQLVAMNTKHAQLLGLQVDKSTFVMVDTASGQSPGYFVSLDTVSIGDIKIQNVRAVVIENEDYPKDVLLGMSFLKQVEMAHKADYLILQMKY